MAVGYGADADNRSLGWEAHAGYAQTFVLLEGSAVLYTGESADANRATRTLVAVGEPWVVAPGTYHELVGRFKALTVYAPPKWAPGTRHETFADARATEAHE